MQYFQLICHAWARFGVGSKEDYKDPSPNIAWRGSNGTILAGLPGVVGDQSSVNLKVDLSSSRAHTSVYVLLTQKKPRQKWRDQGDHPLGVGGLQNMLKFKVCHDPPRMIIFGRVIRFFVGRQVASSLRVGRNWQQKADSQARVA